MASIEKYRNEQEVIFHLNHNFRSSPKAPLNIEIDDSLTKKNYILTPESHGRNTQECLNYFKQRTNNSFIYGEHSTRDIVRCIEWVIQAPSDLAEGQKPDFFKACYGFLNNIYGEENCISSLVHVDEIMVNAKGDRVSHDHMHYMAVPRIQNKNYISVKDKFKNGIATLRKNEFLAENEDVSFIVNALNRFYKKEINKNEAISEITKNSHYHYADSKKIFNAVVRKESESYKTRIKSDAFTSKKMLHEFHPKLQKFLDNLGIKCTVSFKSQGIDRGSFTVDEAKTVTRVTGLSIEQIKDLEIENERLHEQVKSLSQEIEKSKEIETSGWGNSSGWGKESDREWQKEY